MLSVFAYAALLLSSVVSQWIGSALPVVLDTKGFIHSSPALFRAYRRSDLGPAYANAVARTRPAHARVVLREGTVFAHPPRELLRTAGERFVDGVGGGGAPAGADDGGNPHDAGCVRARRGRWGGFCVRVCVCVGGGE